MLRKTCLAVFSATLAITAHAQNIQILTRFADIPAGTTPPTSIAALAKLKGVDVLAAPKVITQNSQIATVEITENTQTVGGATVALGATLKITPSLTEKGSITFKGQLTDRGSSGKRESDNVISAAFVSREIYFQGTVGDGNTAILRTTPAVSGKGESAKTRELVIYLTLERMATSTPTKKSATPTIKPSSSKKPAPTPKKGTTRKK